MQWEFASVSYSRSFLDKKIDGIFLRIFGDLAERCTANPFRGREDFTWTDRRAYLAAELGNDGWELVSADGDTLYFKRPIGKKPR